MIISYHIFMFQHKYFISIVYSVHNMELLQGLLHDKSFNILKNFEDNPFNQSIGFAVKLPIVFFNACML